MATKTQPRKYERFHVMRKARVQNRTYNFLVLTAVCSGLLLIARGVMDNVEPDSFVGRHLLSGSGCKVNELNELDYPEWEMKGGVAVYFVGVIYLFLGIAIVCDDFFVASLEAISEKLKLSEDVAGATFMAAGSSAPELFSSVVSLANPNATSEVGVGTIVGSAVFNVLCIIGVTAIFAGQTLQLDWKPVTRDALFYAASIVSIIVFFNDGMIMWFEGMIAVFCYGLYVLFMVFNAKIMDAIDSMTSKVKPAADDDAETGLKGAADAGGEENSDAIPAVKDTEGEAEPEAEEEEEEDNNPFKPPENAKDYPLWLLSLPWYAAFTITIPDCSKPFWDKFYLLSFVMSIVWIGIISWFMVEWCVVIGCILRIPLSVMGVTVLAAGTSIPDALSSIVVAKQGQGNMAVANAIGSNVFDIWLGLGLPWWVVLLIENLGPKKVKGMCVSTKELIPNILILFSVLIFYFGLLVVFKFKLYVRVGMAFVALYCVFAVFQIVAVWNLDIYNLSIPGVNECICHVEVDGYVTQSCWDAANGKTEAQPGRNPYEEWWTKNNASYVDDLDKFNPLNWHLKESDH